MIIESTHEIRQYLRPYLRRWLTDDQLGRLYGLFLRLDEPINRLKALCYRGVPIHLFADNQRLTESQLAIAKEICDDAIAMVKDRDLALSSGKFDVKFGLPDANWLDSAANEYVRLFRRVSQCNPRDMDHFRILTCVFSGYNLFEARDGRGLFSAALTFDDKAHLSVADSLRKRNWPFIEEWHRQTKGLPRREIFCPPAMLGEIGHDVDGVIVNHDTCTYQERINLLVQFGLMDWLQSKIKSAGEVNICEIGGGYGALCHWLMTALPGASYTIVDLPESILFSRLYLTLTKPGLPTGCGLEPVKSGVRFVPNYLAESLNEKFDLVINTLSMSEMSEYQIRQYLQIMKSTWLRDGGMFFEQNKDGRYCGLLFAQEIIETEFPFRAKLPDGIKWVRNGHPNVWSMRPIELR